MKPRLVEFTFLVSLFVLGWSMSANAKAVTPVVEPKPDWSYVEKRLKKAHLPAVFIADMKKTYKAQDFIKVLELNILLFLRQTDYHSPQVTGDAVEEVRSFVQRNRSAFDTTEKRYGVSREVISSLLFIETRHGANKGTFHVPSVFFHLVQADRPSVIRYLKSRIPQYSARHGKSLQAKIARRAKTKADWALSEIKAVKGMHAQNKKLVKGLKGSFSGAFGMAQFIPSSYVKLARPFKKGHTADLTRADDAIASVAFYLHKHGWKRNRALSQKKALMSYNNSEDYADAILSLAKRASGVNLAAREVQSVKGRKKAKKKNRRAK